MTSADARTSAKPATAACDDLLRLVGDVDERKVFDILALRPTVAEIGQAALWARRACTRQGRPSADRHRRRRLDILTADEEEEPPPIR